MSVGYACDACSSWFRCDYCDSTSAVPPKAGSKVMHGKGAGNEPGRSVAFSLIAPFHKLIQQNFRIDQFETNELIKFAEQSIATAE